MSPRWPIGVETIWSPAPAAVRKRPGRQWQTGARQQGFRHGLGRVSCCIGENLGIGLLFLNARPVLFCRISSHAYRPGRMRRSEAVQPARHPRSGHWWRKALRSGAVLAGLLMAAACAPTAGTAPPVSPLPPVAPAAGDRHRLRRHQGRAHPAQSGPGNAALVAASLRTAAVLALRETPGADLDSSSRTTRARRKAAVPPRWRRSARAPS